MPSVKPKKRKAKGAAKSKAKKAKRVPRRSAPKTTHDTERARLAGIAARRSAAGREIGTIPDIEDPERREKCLKSPRLFLETYNPEPLYFGWADYQLESLDRMDEVMQFGALYAHAEPRGGGKTTRVRMMSLRALAGAICRYAFVIGATDSKAGDTLSAIKMFIRFLPTFAADFPEISVPIQKLGGIANRAAGQTCDGVSTCLEWTSDRIVFPTVPPPLNWPKHWPLRSDGMVPTSGAIFSTSGLTGEGIRGSLKTLTTGEQVRPDFVLLDDPQTTESSHSPAQNRKREELISADVLGMAGPGRKLGAVMPCTIIAPGDAMDRMTNPEIHPLWRGTRIGMLTGLPTNMAAWDQYFEIHRRCAGKEPPDFTEAHNYYAANRDKLDTGTAATWTDRKLPGEVSAIQHAMNLYCRDRRAFMSEYMNAPEAVDLGQIDDLDADEIAGKLNRVPRGSVPPDCTRLTAMVDVGGKVLYWCVCGWAEGFASGAVIDYGVYPKQHRSYFAADDARPALIDLPELRNMDETARVYAGLRATVDSLLPRVFPRIGGGELSIETCGVDAGWNTDTVHLFCRQSQHAARLLPSMGYGIGASAAPMSTWAPKPGERRGVGWVMRPVTGSGRGRTLIVDTNAWKTFVAGRLQTPAGGKGCLSLCGDRPDEHRLFVDHLTSEYRVATEGRGRRLEEWKVRPERRDNHWLDTLVGCAAIAGVLGLVWNASGEPVTPREKKKKVKLSDLYRQKHGVG